MTEVAAVFVASNRGSQRTTNGVRWASKYRAADGTLVYSVEYDQASAGVPATRYADSRSSFGLLVGSKLLLEVVEVAGEHFATRVAIDHDAEYPVCPECTLLSATSVLGADAYLEVLPRYLEHAAAGRWTLFERYEVSDAELRGSSDRPLLSIRCLTCSGEYALRTSGEREASGIHCERLRHSFAAL